MRRTLAFFLLLLAALAPATPATADFGFKDVDVTFTLADGSIAAQAGSHPFEMTTTFNLNTVEDPKFGTLPDGSVKDLEIDQPSGLAFDPRAVPRCSSADFLLFTEKTGSACPDSAAIGYTEVFAAGATSGDLAAIYNLTPAPGSAAKLGFRPLNYAVTIEGGLRASDQPNVFAQLTNIAQAEPVTGSRTILWGNPAEDAHDALRGNCLVTAKESCPADIAERPFITLPRSCQGPLPTLFAMDSWQAPGAWVSAQTETHDDSIPPNPLGMSGCDGLGFGPDITAAPTTDRTESPSGLDFALEINDEGLTNPDPEATAQSDIKKAVVTLPAGVTINPSQAEGLAVCSEAQLASETATSEFGAGCPPASKVGTVEVETPLLEGEILKGSLFVAEPYANRFGTLIAIYQVIKSPELGIVVKLAGKVEPDPKTGQLITTFDNVPQLPVSDFRLHFREGGRSPLVTPALCGTYETKALFYPWARPEAPFPVSSSFQITKGVEGGPCPTGGTPPFVPGFEAGSLNNNAGAFSPFYMRLTRRDADQDMTKFSSILPPGVVGKLVGVSKCPDAAIALAKAKSGRAELASPSCPASAQIGRTVSGAGVGSQLTFVGGKLYLAGPIGGNPLSVVAIVPAVAGPFDVGTVVVRVALRLNPITAEVEADGAASDPIPHILAGIPLKVKDLRVHVDRENFILNPTGCDPSQVRAQLWGGGLDPFSTADDAPVSLATRYQAASCLNLGFKPKLALKLKGGTKRGDHPALQAILRPRAGDANLARTVVRLPRSAFLDQGHIRTVCTRVQFAADACPAGAIYGKVTAFSPLLEEPLSGPAFLRSSNNKLPDLVYDLHGIVDIETAARIDSIKGGIRATFPAIPDAPVSKVIVEMQGGKKGLIVNSRDLCAAPARATVNLEAHNGKELRLRPLMQARCGKRAKR